MPGTKDRGSAPGRIGAWRYVLLAVVVTIGGLYAAPNLFPPDFALQVTADNAEQSVDEAFLAELEELLRAADIATLGSERVPNGGLIRLTSSDDQLRCSA